MVIFIDHLSSKNKKLRWNLIIKEELNKQNQIQMEIDLNINNRPIKLKQIHRCFNLQEI